MTEKSLYPSDQADKVLVRMPDGMRDHLKDAAKANNRTMNAEIVARLEGSFEAHTGAAARLPLLAEEYIEEQLVKHGIDRTSAIEAMAAKAQSASGTVIIIHYSPRLKLNEFRDALNQMLENAPDEAHVLIYPSNSKT